MLKLAKQRSELLRCTHDPRHPPERVALDCLHACLRVCASRHIDTGEVACVVQECGLVKTAKRFCSTRMPRCVQALWV